MTKPQDIHNDDWDLLIILDACRYDFFATSYDLFLRGNLEKRISPGTHTLEWLKNTFTNYYNDIIYISGNLYINKLDKQVHRKIDFRAINHFPLEHIHELWVNNWINGTVYPKDINYYYHLLSLKHPDKRFILHYIQPHTPHLHEYSMTLLEDRTPSEIAKGNLNKYIFNDMVHIIRKHLGSPFIWKLKDLLGKNEFQIAALYRKGVWDFDRLSYTYNLHYALNEVRNLLSLTDKRIIITSDHGELLGEYNQFGHLPQPRYKELIEVPWFTVKPR